jgi:cell division protein FtsB
MSDEQIWNAAAFVLYWGFTALAAAAGVAWWFKDKLTSAQIEGLRAANEAVQAENDALKTNVRLAETAATAETKGLRAANDALRDQNDTLKANVRLAESAASSEVKGLQAQIGALEKTCALMEQRINLRRTNVREPRTSSSR